MAIPEGYEKLAAIGIAYKGVYAESTAYKYLNAVFYSGSTFVALKDNPVKPPVSDGTNWQYLAQGFVEGVMSAVNATDTSGVIGTAGEEINAQTLIDAIADRVMTKLVPTSKIVNNLLATDAGTVLAGPQGKALSDSIAEVNSNLTIRNHTFIPNSAGLITSSIKVKQYGKIFILCGTFVPNQSGDGLTLGSISGILPMENTAFPISNSSVSSASYGYLRSTDGVFICHIPANMVGSTCCINATFYLSN